MRPPMQKSALQQNEASRHQQQHQTQLQQQQSATVHLIPHRHLQQQQQQQLHLQQLQQQQQPPQQQPTTVVATAASKNIVDCNSLITATTAAERKSQKLEQHELLVENHLNNACFAQAQHPATHPLPTPTALQPHLQHKLKDIGQQQLVPASVVFYNEFYQQQQRPKLLQHVGEIEDNLSGVKLLDLSTSPPGGEDPGSLEFRTSATERRDDTQQRQSAASQRYSYSSQYSRSSSSDDSSSLSLSTACGSLGIGGVLAGGAFIKDSRERSNSSDYNSGSTTYNSYNNTFDDAAENFIINFPADTSPSTQPLPTPLIPGRAVAKRNTTQQHQPPQQQQQPQQQLQHQAPNYCLPLSETEPLLTNIEATVKDRQRSIYLNKNSASLIFTKKDLSQTAATYQHQQQQFKLQSKTNNNFNGGSGASTTSSSSFSSNTLLSSSSSTFSSPSTNTSVRRSLAHSTTLRSFSEENYSSLSSSVSGGGGIGRRKPTKHLPATYHQQHRRSLQLNYNNNLVTTSTCGSLANNNHHHQQQQQHHQHCCKNSNGASNSNSAVLHKPHHNKSNHQHKQQQQQHQQQQQSSGYINSGSTNNTATATRKQYAYSWYAPVYSALEEELEHDSRDSSPIHNLAATKKSSIQQYHRQHDLNSLSLTAPATDTDNEREALLESRNSINIQTHLSPTVNHKRGGGGVVVGVGGGGSGSEPFVKQLNPSKLALQHSRNSSVKGGFHTAKGISLNGGGGGVGLGSGGDIAAVEGFTNYDLEGPHAGSLGLAGGPQPRRIRFGNFLKSLVGLRPSAAQRSNGNEGVVAAPPASATAGSETGGSHTPSSPEITITRTPSEQNMVVLRDPCGRQDYNVVYSSREKLANSAGDRSIQTGSTSSLNVMQQKLWNIMRREGSALSLHQEKSQSIVHYTGLRKCETVIALTRQTTTSPCSPTLSGNGAGGGGGSVDGGGGGNGRGTAGSKSQNRLCHTGSGIFSASGVEQIRPLNRLRNSVSSMNNTCSRCSSLLSLAASSSRFSLSNGTLANHHPHHTHQHHSQTLQQQQTTHFPHHQYQHQRYPSNVSSSNISSVYSQSRDGSVEAGLHFAVKRNSRTSCSSGAAAAGMQGCQRYSNSTAASSRTTSLTSPSATTAATASTTKPTTPPSPAPTDNPHTPCPPSATACDVRFLPAPMEPAAFSAPLTVTSLMNMATSTEMFAKLKHPNKDEQRPIDSDVIDGVSSNNKGSSVATTLSTGAPMNVTSSTTANALVATAASASTMPSAMASASVSASSPESIIASILLGNATTNANMIATNAVATLPTPPPSLSSSSSPPPPPPSCPFELFTCKLCLIDVEDASNSTVLHQCGCQFCTECMKAYVEFEISEGAYEISCPDAQCPEQGAMTLPEIAKLTTTNLMKKHHRYRLNREIELDKTRTWCPRAGCETVCLIGPTSSTQSDGDPSASTSAAAAASSATPTANVAAAAISPSLMGIGIAATGTEGNIIPTPLQCAVQCPSCKDEFCSACKKTWHPNITCEEHGRRLAADGQDDIGIPFDNDLIKCCPMCAVPIEKDEGCAQMMCKRCKHVFCWYCLASLDDDFLLRHYDKGPCKNKLGHSRASVVWHRAQVIGIFAGFGILLLVASPLLLLAAPCIICCKCRSCSGSKIDEVDGDMDEATALQSLN